MARIYSSRELASGDRTLERIYRRLGTRIIVACQLVNFAYGFLLGLTFALGFIRIKRASASDALAMCGMWAALFVLCAAVASLGVLRSARPLVRWIDGDRDPASAEAAWRTALRLPVTTARWYALATLCAAPLFAVALDMIEPAPLPIVLTGYGIGYAVGAAAIASATMFTAQLAARPLVREVARALSRPPAPSGGVSVRTKLLTVAPALLVPPLFWGAAVTVKPGTDVGRSLVELSVGFGLLVAFGVPLVLLLAYSTLQPLEDLLHATERLRQGDLSTRVPELSADEHGLLAHSFNEAIEGLAEREHLAAENATLLDEVRASRARIVAASDAERRRVERNIHDGAQQRLMAVALKLRMLEERTSDDPDLRVAVKQASDGLKGALTELRDLARGLHPAVLATDGLRPALRQLASHSSLQVSVDAPSARFPEPIESAAYFVACEALANVAKHADTSHAEISVERRHATLLVRVHDDGIGGAHNGTGTGLTGLADRVAALGGRLAIDSPPARGTTLTAELPLP